MSTIEILMKKRNEIIEKIRQIDTLTRGTINEQYLKVAQKNSEPVLRGPYYVLSKSIGGKTRSQRIKTQDLEEFKKNVSSYNDFVSLSNEFVEVTEQITQTLRSEKTNDCVKKNINTR